jgi:hypothetical protein
MKSSLRLVALIALAICVVPARSQNTSTQANEGSEPVTQLKLQIVFTEMDGVKKISSLPYILRVPASAHPTVSKFRQGVRIPLQVGGKDKNGDELSWQYLDVGTNIDWTAKPLDGGRYQLHLNAVRSMVYTSTTPDKPVGWSATDPLPPHPIIGQFSEESDLIIRDGQTLQAMMGGDPVTGHVMTMDVTINVEK